MEEISYRPLIETMVWSYSRLEIFDDCPYRWFLSYIHTPKMHKEEKFYAVYGLLMHDLLEKFYKGQISKDEMIISYLTRFVKETDVAGKPKSSIVESYFKSGKEYISNIKPLPYETVSVEETFNFNIEGIPFTGRIDYIGLEDGEYVIVDNKSRNLKPRSKRKNPTVKDKELDTMLRQLYIYAEAVRQKYGKLPKKLCFNCFKNGEYIEEPFNEDAFHETLSWVKNKVEEISGADDFYPNVEFFSCRYLCGYSYDCCYTQTSERKGGY